MAISGQSKHKDKRQARLQRKPRGSLSRPSAVRQFSRAAQLAETQARLGLFGGPAWFLEGRAFYEPALGWPYWS